MKDYSLNEQERKAFITDLKKVKDKKENESYEVTFADGRVFKGIEVDKDNFDKVEAQMQMQARDGIRNLPAILKKRKISGIITAVSAAFTTCGALYLTLPKEVITTDPIAIGALALGTISICTLIPATTKLVKSNKKIKELSKIQYMIDNQKTLESYKEYPNALEGVGDDAKSYFRRTKDPFLMVDLDSYEEKDLRTIVDNIIMREQAYNFNYPKKVK